MSVNAGRRCTRRIVGRQSEALVPYPSGAQGAAGTGKSKHGLKLVLGCIVDLARKNKTDILV
jgi:hypothetical protein